RRVAAAAAARPVYERLSLCGTRLHGYTDARCGAAAAAGCGRRGARTRRRHHGDHLVDQHRPAVADALIRAAALAALIVPATDAAAALDALCRRPPARIEKVMQRERAKGYDLARTPNGVRLQAAVILDLVRARIAADPERRPLWLGHADYFNAYLGVTGLQMEAAPAFARIAYEYHEDYIVDYRIENVIDEVRRGRPPRLAVNVIAGWRGCRN